MDLLCSPKWLRKYGFEDSKRDNFKEPKAERDLGELVQGAWRNRRDKNLELVSWDQGFNDRRLRRAGRKISLPRFFVGPISGDVGGEMERESEMEM